VRQFIENTDLSSQTVAIIQYNFDSCKSIDVEFVKWQEVENRELSAHKVGIGAPLTKPDSECTRNPREYIGATVVRIPADINEIVGSSVGGAVDPAVNC